MKRSALPRRGRKAKREAASIRNFSAALRERSGGWCEAVRLNRPGTIEPVCTPVRHYGVHPHHIWPEDRDRGVHDPTRGVWLCAAAHDWVHDHPADAKTVGLLRPDR